MTNAELEKALNDLHRKYCTISYFTLNIAIQIKRDMLKQMLEKLSNWNSDNTEEILQKVKFDFSIKRKYIVSVFTELGLKVTRYTREYGKTIVYFEPISDSQ